MFGWKYYGQPEPKGNTKQVAISITFLLFHFLFVCTCLFSKIIPTYRIASRKLHAAPSRVGQPAWVILNIHLTPSSHLTRQAHSLTNIKPTQFDLWPKDTLRLTPSPGARAPLRWRSRDPARASKRGYHPALTSLMSCIFLLVCNRSIYPAPPV